MTRIEKIAHQLLCDIEGLPTLNNVQHRDIKLDLIKDALGKVKRNERILSPEEKEWMEEKWTIFYDKYQKKKSGATAKKAWMKLEREEVEEILKTVDEFVRVNDDVTFRPLPASYINGRRWEDELPSQRKSAVSNRRPVKENSWHLT